MAERKEIAKRIVMMRHVELRRPSARGTWHTTIAVPVTETPREGSTYTYAGEQWTVAKRWMAPWPKAVE